MAADDTTTPHPIITYLPTQTIPDGESAKIGTIDLNGYSGPLVFQKIGAGHGVYLEEGGFNKDGVEDIYGLNEGNEIGQVSQGYLAFLSDGSVLGLGVSFNASPYIARQASFGSSITYQSGTFNITGTVSSPSGVGTVEISALVDGEATDLGAATVNADGTFTFADRIGGHTQTAITATATDGKGITISAQAPYSLTGGLPGARAEQDTYSADGATVLSQTTFRSNGARAVNVQAAGQIIDLQPFDLVQNHRQAETTFVFSPGDGLDVIHGFKLGGADHDTLQLPSADFANLAAVFRNTGDVGGSAFITDPNTGDAIRLAGVTTAELKAHRKDITLV